MNKQSILPNEIDKLKVDIRLEELDTIMLILENFSSSLYSPIAKSTLEALHDILLKRYQKTVEKYERYNN